MLMTRKTGLCNFPVRRLPPTDPTMAKPKSLAVPVLAVGLLLFLIAYTDLARAQLTEEQKVQVVQDSLAVVEQGAGLLDFGK